MISTRTILTAGCILFLLPVALPVGALAQAKPDKDKPKQEKQEKKENQKDQGEADLSIDFKIDFNTKDARRYAVDYDLIGQKPLPPGIRKNLARGKPLPPGIAKRSLPSPFVKQLPAHKGYEWQMAGTDLVLISTADKVVREIAKDVFK